MCFPQKELLGGSILCVNFEDFPAACLQQLFGRVCSRSIAIRRSTYSLDCLDINWSRSFQTFHFFLSTEQFLFSLPYRNIFLTLNLSVILVVHRFQRVLVLKSGVQVLSFERVMNTDLLLSMSEIIN